ncbi:MAG: pseudouridine synthase [Proteobacteria bacterium]|nr:MAG: pseudouridine synthase [Pseudomonadota bacterium]
MSEIIVFNKPYQVMSQFTDAQQRAHLGDYIEQPGFYPAGRLDYDSEGLMLLTDDGVLQNKISGSDWHKTYLIQVEGIPKAKDLTRLRTGITIKDYQAKTVDVAVLAKKPGWLWSRNPAVRFRKKIPTSWLTITLDQGKNRQVRHMLAAVNLPVLRLIRIKMGTIELADLQPGDWRWQSI